MITKVMMPQVGQDMEVGRIVRWIKKEGEPVKKGDALCEVETEKAVVEVPSPAEGILIKVLYPDNAEVKILTEIGLVGDPTDSPAKSAHSEVQTKDTIQPFEPAIQAVKSPPQEAIGRIRISPKAKKIATENNLPLEKLTGSGPQGRIIEKDVRGFMEKQPASPQSARPVNGKKGHLPLSKIRKITAQRLQHSKQTIPHFYISMTVDMSACLRLQKELNEKYHLPRGATISINDFIVRACALAIRDFPELNSTFSEEGLLISQDIDIGVAVSVEEGLIVPVIENCDQLDMRSLSARTRQVVLAARSGRQLITRPGRFTISNLGMYHVEDFAAIINPPEVGILAVGAVRKQLAVKEDGSFFVQDQMKITLSVDHRVVDGVMAAKFLNRVREILETTQGI
jgi:pyruvate dehydrogenase E2 component (dihydrolipoamide acetyltransferase)